MILSCKEYTDFCSQLYLFIGCNKWKLRIPFKLYRISIDFYFWKHNSWKQSVYSNKRSANIALSPPSWRRPTNCSTYLLFYSELLKQCINQMGTFRYRLHHPQLRSLFQNRVTKIFQTQQLLFLCQTGTFAFSQLNMYNFHKIRENSQESYFHHEHFNATNKDALA